LLANIKPVPEGWVHDEKPSYERQGLESFFEALKSLSWLLSGHPIDNICSSVVQL
jgi:hypothetical protein